MVKNLFKISDLSNDEILYILDMATKFKSTLKNFKFSDEKFIANLFFEPSTRTHYSFVSAQLSLGMKIIDPNLSFSSILKGESLYDTAKTFESIGANALIIRDKKDEYFNDLEGINISIINAGDGCGHHPSQCLLDLLTIKEEFGHFDGLNVSIIGDIKHSRVANSNASALKSLGANVYFSAPKIWQKDGNYLDIDKCVEISDVVMLLRVQNERLDKNEGLNLSNEEYLNKFGLNKKRYSKLKPNAIIMHPAPVNRGVEIDGDLIEYEKSRIFKQMSNGVLARKAILKWIFE